MRTVLDPSYWWNLELEQRLSLREEMKGPGKRLMEEKGLNRDSRVGRVMIESCGKGQEKWMLQWVGG